jgi:hypothetical protein
MDGQGVLDRIDRWQAAGLIDAATADRLRAAEAASPAQTVSAPAVAASTPPSGIGSTAADVFGPSVTVVEMFAYLGTAFLLAAVAAFSARISSGSDHAEAILGAGAGVEAIALAAIGLVLRSGTPRRRRAAGISFVAAVVAAGSAFSLFGSTVGVDGQVVAVISTGVALAVALAFRLLLPAVTTELAVLGTITALSSSLLVWIEAVVAPPPYFLDNGLVTSTGVDPLILVLGAAIWWLATAFLLGIMGLMEAHRGRTDPAAQRRAGVVRLWAGLTAVLGLFYAVSQAASGGPEGPIRTLEPVIGDLAVLVVAAILLERAYRRESNAYIFAAAIGCIAALTDLDGSYLSSTPDVALLLEGVILIVVGFGAEVLRRRLLVPAAVGPGTAAPA